MRHEDRHGWGTDGSDVDTEIDSVTVRLSTGAPTITGTAQVGQTLTAVTTGITDADGLTSATYTYQWIQVNGTAADIAGENSSTYTLVDADLGKAIKVKVSFTDDASNAETRTSAATATVTADTTTSMSGVLVSNVGQTESEAPGLRSIEAAQSFTTGANATGYTLTSIELRLTSAATDRAAPTVKLFRGSANGTEVATLTGPTMLDASATENYAFTPTTTVNLLTSTIYWVVVVAVADSAVSWPATLSNSEDATSATGWEIGASAERSAGSTGGFRPVRVSAFLIRVNGTTPVTNTAPTVATAILDQTATVGTLFIFNVPENTFTDADSDTLTYSATQSDGSALPSWLTFDALGPGFSGTPQAADVETVSVKVTASDGNGGSVSDTFDIVVSADTTVNCAGMCLVSNVGQTSADVQGFADTDFAQSFTTGAHATGYTLTSIELKLSSSSGVTTTPTVKLFSGSANGTEEATFIGPPMLGSGEANYTFTPSSTVNLGMSTTYWVVAEGTCWV